MNWNFQTVMIDYIYNTSRDPQQCCGDDLNSYFSTPSQLNLQPSLFQSVQRQYTNPPNKSLMALQLAKLAKFMKEQM